MENKTQIINWLVIGISQSPNSLNEKFYFDKENSDFFSILFTDYLMIDGNFDVAKNTTTSYSKSNQNILINLIKRVEYDDEEIISIPRLTNRERKDFLIQFLKSIDNSDEKKRIEGLYLNAERTYFDKKFDIESEQETVDEWNDFKNKILLSKADSFLNLNNINTDSSRVLEFEEEGSITIDLTINDKGHEIDKKRKWWEFWK